MAPICFISYHKTIRHYYKLATDFKCRYKLGYPVLVRRMTGLSTISVVTTNDRELPSNMHFSRVLGYLFTREYELRYRDEVQNTIAWYHVGYGWLAVGVSHDGNTSVTTSGVTAKLPRNNANSAHRWPWMNIIPALLSSLLKRGVLSHNWRVYFENILKDEACFWSKPFT